MKDDVDEWAIWLLKQVLEESDASVGFGLTSFAILWDLGKLVQDKIFGLFEMLVTSGKWNHCKSTNLTYLIMALYNAAPLRFSNILVEFIHKNILVPIEGLREGPKKFLESALNEFGVELTYEFRNDNEDNETQIAKCIMVVLQTTHSPKLLEDPSLLELLLQITVLSLNRKSGHISRSGGTLGRCLITTSKCHWSGSCTRYNLTCLDAENLTQNELDKKLFAESVAVNLNIKEHPTFQKLFKVMVHSLLDEIKNSIDALKAETGNTGLHDSLPNTKDMFEKILVFKNGENKPVEEKSNKVSQKFALLRMQVSSLCSVIEKGDIESIMIDNHLGFTDNLNYIRRELGWLLIDTNLFEYPKNRECYAHLMACELPNLDSVWTTKSSLAKTLDRYKALMTFSDYFLPLQKLDIANNLIPAYQMINEIFRHENGPYGETMQNYYNKYFVRQTLPNFCLFYHTFYENRSKTLLDTFSKVFLKGGIRDSPVELQIRLVEDMLATYEGFRAKMTEKDHNLFAEMIHKGIFLISFTRVPIKDFQIIDLILRATKVVKSDTFPATKKKSFELYMMILQRAIIQDQPEAEAIAERANYFKNSRDSLNEFLIKITPLMCVCDSLGDDTLGRLITNLLENYSSIDED
jgi:hypothetical protein